MNLSEIGVTVAKEKQFLQKGIDSVEKLLQYYPRKYIDCRCEKELSHDEFCVFKAKVISVTQHEGNTVDYIRASCHTSDFKRVSVMWFRKRYLYPMLGSFEGDTVLIAGKVTYSPEYNNYSVSEPFLFTPDTDNAKRLYPVYSKIPRMSDDFLSGKMSAALEHKDIIEDILPESVRRSLSYLPMRDAIASIHHPKDLEELKRAQERLIFNDLLYFSINIERSRRSNSLGSQYNVTNFESTRKVLDSLPYRLTEDQRSVMKELVGKARDGRRINALIQGDVGTGKSIIAYLTMLAMVDSGYQTALMAPTQVLAQQHYDELVKLVEPLGMNVVLLGGTKLKKAERERILGGIKDGSVQFIVGTHALLNPDIEFKDLSLVVVDEEHKFGVLQREAILEKASRGVHFITMSATPIPRSLAQVIYGEGVQLCTIKTMPAGRKPIITIQAHNQESVFNFIAKQVKLGRQIYIVCPMIDQNEDMEGVVSIEELEKVYSNALSPLGITTATLTGRNTKDELNEIIASYKAGKTDVLLATTVIEVGVNVPNASAIIIHNAERFGLAGLHQLRGRVGRGEYQSYCVLFTQEEDNPRLNAMCSTNDGFKIAEEDLKLRGAGELIGLKQSGDDKYLSLMLTYPTVFDETKKIATSLVNSGEYKEVLNRYEALCVAKQPQERSTACKSS